MSFGLKPPLVYARAPCPLASVAPPPWAFFPSRSWCAPQRSLPAEYLAWSLPRRLMSWPCRVCNLATWNDRSTCRGCDQAKPSTAKTKTAPGKGKGQQKTSSASVDVSASSKSRVAIIKEEQTIAEARDRPLGEQSLEVLKAARPEAKTSRAALSVTTPGGDHASPGEPHRGLAQGAGREEAPR